MPALTMIKSLIKKNRQRLNQELPDIEQRKYFSPALYILTGKILRALNTHARGRLLDIGCGDMPFKGRLPEAVTQYDTLDVESRTEGVTYITSAMDMSMIPDNSYDSAMCFEVLEHVPNPFTAAAEMHRVLKQDGTLVISVPHMWPIHEAPHDYLRFTYYGIKNVLEASGFEIVSIEISGGLLTYFGHNLASVLLGLTYHIPVIKHIMFFLVKWLIVLPWAWIDDKVVRSEITPLEYLCVARKQA